MLAVTFFLPAEGGEQQEKAFQHEQRSLHGLKMLCVVIAAVKIAKGPKQVVSVQTKWNHGLVCLQCTFLDGFDLWSNYRKLRQACHPLNNRRRGEVKSCELQ